MQFTKVSIAETVNTTTPCKSIYTDANRLYEAFFKSVKASKWKGRVISYSLDCLSNIFRLQRELETKTWHPDPVHKFVQNERGRTRLISSSSEDDRIIRHVTCDDILMPEVRKRIIYDNAASLKGRGNSFSQRRFEIHLHKFYREYGTNQGWIGFYDFSKFYDNIVHSIAKRQFLELVPDAYLQWVLDRIYEEFEVDVSYLSDEEYSSCVDGLFVALDYFYIPDELKTGKKFMPKSVNIGDQLSQLNGIFYPHRIDTYVKHVRGIKYYGRYMDDGYVMSSSKQEIESVFNGIRDICNELGIHLNENKTRIVKMSGTYKFLQIKYTLTEKGYVIKRINPARVTAMRRKLKKLHAKVYSGEIEYKAVEQMFRSWMGSFYKLMSKSQRKELISLFESLFDKKITIVHRKMHIIDQGCKEVII